MVMLNNSLTCVSALQGLMQLLSRRCVNQLLSDVTLVF